MVLKRPAIRRFAHIDRRIRDPLPPTATQLAVELEVAVRTVYRDIDYMRDQLGAPISFDPVRGGYHYDQPSYRLPPLTLSEGEVLALFLAERTFRQYQGTPYEGDIARLFKKLVAVLPEQITIDPATLDTLYSIRPVATSLHDIETFRTLAKAVLHHRTLHATYYTASRDAVTERDIDPYHLANIGGEWYLFAYCHLRKDVLVFRPDRFRKLRLLGKGFDRPPDFTPARHLDNALAVYSDEGKPRRIVLEFDEFAARYIREKVWHMSQKLISKKSGGVRLEVLLSSYIEIKRFALGWGEHCRVVRPKALVEDVAAEIARMGRSYR